MGSKLVDRCEQDRKASLQRELARKRKRRMALIRAGRVSGDRRRGKMQSRVQALKHARSKATDTPECLAHAILHARLPEDKRRIAWARFIWKRYRLTTEAYAHMWDQQSGACRICMRELRMGRGGACIDHDHKTGHVRGILCTFCNKWFLGALERGGRARLCRAVVYIGWGRLID